jgi:hypothetical protein
MVTIITTRDCFLVVGLGPRTSRDMMEFNSYSRDLQWAKGVQAWPHLFAWLDGLSDNLSRPVTPSRPECFLAFMGLNPKSLISIILTILLNHFKSMVIIKLLEVITNILVVISYVFPQVCLTLTRNKLKIHEDRLTSFVQVDLPLISTHNAPSKASISLEMKNT